MRNLSIAILCVFLSNLLFSQEVKRCAYDEMMQFYETQYPGFNKLRGQAFDYAKAVANSNTSAKNTYPADSIIQVPVVVHIVYENPAENLHDSLVYSQIDMLNQSFRMQNPDTSNLRSFFDTLRADAGIEFFLAKVDPNGDSTSGITRTQTVKTTFASGLLGITGLDEIKMSSTGGANAWNTEKYLNIWVGDFSISDPIFGNTPSVLGKAYPPMGISTSIWPSTSPSPNPGLDGVIIHYEVFGVKNPLAVGQVLSIADMGRTAVHEVGHYLGLRHIWGDGGNPLFPGSIDCSVDDHINDTPNSGNNSQQSGCDPNKNTCTEASGFDYPDLWENYMDYSDEVCQVMFTHGQVALMRSSLINLRSGVVAEGRRQNPSVNVSINEISGFSSFDVYPNPTSGVLNINFEIDNKSESVIEVIGLDAKTYFRRNVTANENSTQLNLNGLAPGIYFVHLSNLDVNEFKRIILH